MQQIHTYCRKYICVTTCSPIITIFSNHTNRASSQIGITPELIDDTVPLQLPTRGVIIIIIDFALGLSGKLKKHVHRFPTKLRAHRTNFTPIILMPSNHGRPAAPSNTPPPPLLTVFLP